MTNTWEAAGLASELQTHNLTAPSGAKTPGRSILGLFSGGVSSYLTGASGPGIIHWVI